MENFLSSLVSVAFHGLAYGMILYVISVGLSVTMGLMGFTNLAHGVFAMTGGYVLVVRGGASLKTTHPGLHLARGGRDQGETAVSGWTRQAFPGLNGYGTIFSLQEFSCVTASPRF